MKQPKTIYVCSACGSISSKWVGKCPDCDAWNTMEEQLPAIEHAKASTTRVAPAIPAAHFEDVETGSEIRSLTNIGELDRVLGGGIVDGSVVLLSGEPGIGKSTLLLQICAALAKEKKVLYVSGEESRAQLKMRYNRLGLSEKGIWLLTETNTDAILSECERLSPDIVIIDSVQVLYSDRFTSGAGSISQVKEGAMTFIHYAKTSGAAVFLVGHVNKEGGISGPKLLEHMVDAVLYFEGERMQSYRIIRSIKNRFGSTNEIGVFEMTGKGLREIANPSQAMMEQRSINIPGSCACCVMEGSRPLICEIQSLVSPTNYGAGKRTSDGFDYNRMCLLLAVLERRVRGLQFSQRDVYLNIVAGMRLDEPGVDLAVACALISGYTDRAVPPSLIALGEIGLAGEVRSISHIEQRVNESARLGFTTILLPKRNLDNLISKPKDVKLVGISEIYEVVPYFIKKPEKTVEN